MISRLINH